MNADLARHIGDIARAILGEPNTALSTRQELRFGQHGSVAVVVRGPKAGAWYDHENERGGGVWDLIRVFGSKVDGEVVAWLKTIGIEIDPKPGFGRMIATYYYRDESGKLLFQVVRFEPKDFKQRRPDGAGGWIWNTKGVRKVLYRLPELLGAAKASSNGSSPRVYIVEGEKDVDRLRDQWGLTATTNPGGASQGKSKWHVDYNQFFVGCDVVIIPDNDDTGRKHVLHVAANLTPFAAMIRIAELGGLPEKGDISDWMDAGGTKSDLETLIELTAPFTANTVQEAQAASPPGQTKSTIVEPGKRHIGADEGISALGEAGIPFYQRNRKIVRVALIKAKTSSGETIIVPGIVPVDQPFMERELGRSAVWQRFDARKRGYVVIDPPSPVASQILAMSGHWPFPPLHGITQCPTLRYDGTLLDAEGYDEDTGLLLVGNVNMPPISLAPTREQAETALELLLGLLAEFPFVDNDSKAVALSMLITPVIRGAMPVAPMHLITKPLPGTGASYLLDCAAMIATGEVCAVESMAPRYEETEKRLIGAALSGFPIIAVDNVREIVAGEFFCQVVERPLMSLRALGSSDKLRIPNTFTVFANGNNAAVAEDMVRRTIRCEIDANVEHPEKRAFAFDPLSAIQRNRGKYIAAALTIPLAYIAAGRPEAKSPLASFGAWSSLVRDPLAWLNCGDPLATQDSLRTDDPHKEAVAEVFDTWKSALGVAHENRFRVSDLIEQTKTQVEFRRALTKVASRRRRDGQEAEIDPRLLGNWLRRHRGTIATKIKLAADYSINAARPQWYLQPIR
jgi:putative DNA primase/helicase